MSAPFPAPSDALPSAESCASCGTALHGAYCHACGEKRLDHHDYALAYYLEHAVDTVTHFDVKVVKGIWALLRHPGCMTADVLAGRRVAWPKPMQLFLITNLLYFFIAHRVGIMVFNTALRFHLGNWYGSWAQARISQLTAGRHTTAAALTTRFNHLADTLSKSLIFVFIPLLAILLAVLLWRQRRYFLEHVLVATHLISQILLTSMLLIIPVFLLYTLLQWLHIPLSYQQSDLISTALMLLVIGAWTYPLLRRAYGLGPLGGTLATAGVAVGFFWLLKSVYRFLLFLVTYWLL